MSVVIGTAGHIDHGKTALLRMLTGIDADRLPEERRRGMTIDVGYAYLRLPDDDVLDFVDVPGHDRLIGNMLVGAGEIDAALLIVAADDGPRAQTFEHLAMLDALGIEHGVGVVTKVDLVDAARRDAVEAEVRALLARTRLAGSPVVVVSSVTGDGSRALLDALIGLRDQVRASSPMGGAGARLAIDRAFSVRGFGTVVTGSLRDGELTRDARLRVEPGGDPVRVRGIQVRDVSTDRAIGGRTALNLAGVEVAALRRGMVVTSAPALVASDRLLVALTRPSDLGAPGPDAGRWPPGDRTRGRLSIGTAQVGATIGRGGRDAATLSPDRAVATLRLEEPVAVAAGDRFVLRRPSPGSLVAGGRVLDARPPVSAGRRRQTPGRLAALAAAVGAGDRDRIAMATLDLHGVLAPEPGSPGRVADDVAWAAADAVLDAVAAHHRGAPGSAGMPVADARSTAGRAMRRAGAGRVPMPVLEAVAADCVASLITAGRLVRSGDRVNLPGHASPMPDPARSAAMDRLVRALSVAAPPPLAAALDATACPPDAARALERDGRIVVLGSDVAYSTDTYRELADVATRMARAAPLTPAALRDATGTSRRYVMAILEDLDRRGVLRRGPDGHVLGPRATLPDALP